MKTKTIKIYEFKELKEDIKKKVLQDNYDINVDHDWYNYYTKEYTEELGKIGFEFAEIFFSGFSSQGDGLCFNATVNLEMILKHLKYGKREIARAMKLQELDCLQLNISRTGYWNIYSHEKTRCIDNVGDRDVEKMITIFKADELIDKIEKDVEDLRLELCKKYYKLLNEAYDFLTSDEEIIGTIEANEYTFTIEGKVEN